MIQLEFKLEQQTPLLHFQHTQQGATLRATEVKPRFDRWLVQKVWNNQFQSCKTFLVGYDPKKPDDLERKFNEGYRALNYKMRIEPVGQQTCEEICSQRITDGGKVKLTPLTPMYFGYDDELTPEQNLKAVSHHDGVILKCLILDSVIGATALRDAIKGNISEFFMHRNFGTRATKGYGSFTVEGDCPVKCRYSMFTSDAPDWKGMLDDVELFYKTIRGGINFPHRNMYFKSLMFAYAKSLGMRWDKKTIKEHLLTQKEIGEQISKHPDPVTSHDPDVLTYRDGEDDDFDFRDILGLSTDELWAYYGVKLSKTGDMKRFPSPILFKPVRREANWDIYVIWNELPAEIYTKTIIVNAKLDAASARRAVGGVGVPLSTSASPLVELHIPDGLTVCGYMDYLFGKNASGNYHVNPADYFMSGPGNVRNRIVSIYDQLRKNYRP